MLVTGARGEVSWGFSAGSFCCVDVEDVSDDGCVVVCSWAAGSLLDCCTIAESNCCCDVDCWGAGACCGAACGVTGAGALIAGAGAAGAAGVTLAATGTAVAGSELPVADVPALAGVAVLVAAPWVATGAGVLPGVGATASSIVCRVASRPAGASLVGSAESATADGPGCLLEWGSPPVAAVSPTPTATDVITT